MIRTFLSRLLRPLPFLALVLLIPAPRSHAQTFTIEASTSSVAVGNGLTNGCIFPNKMVGLLVNNGAGMRLYNASVTLVRTLDLYAKLGNANPINVIGLANNNILLLKGAQFMIIDQTGATVTALTSTGMSSYAGGNYLKATELSNGDIAFDMYTTQVNGSWGGETFVRIFHQNGMAVTAAFSVDNIASGKPTNNGSHYQGDIASSGNGSFLVTYSIYVNTNTGQINTYGVVLNNDGTANTWPQNGKSQYQVGQCNGFGNSRILVLGNNNFIVMTPRGTPTIFSSTGAAVPGATIPTLDYYQQIYIDKSATTPGYGIAYTDPSLEPVYYDARDNYTGQRPLYTKKFNNDGSVQQAQTALITGYYHRTWDDDWWDFNPYTQPAAYPVNSIGGGYGLVIQNYLNNDATYSLTTQMFGGSTLPITLMNFTATASGARARLSWQTATEQNSKDFVIQRSGDGITYTDLAAIPAAGNSASTLSYTFTDAQPLHGTNFYRLESVDLDGSSTISPIKQVTFGETAASLILSIVNPVEDGRLQVRMRAPSPFAFYDNEGKLLAKGAFQTGTNYINVSRYPTGVYILLTGNEQKKIVIR